MTDDEHRVLAQVLNSVQGMMAVSNYECELMDKLYRAPKWIKTVAPEKTIHSTKGKRAEALWTNIGEKPARGGHPCFADHAK